MTVRYTHLAPKRTLAAVELLENPNETSTDTEAFQTEASQQVVLQ